MINLLTSIVNTIVSLVAFVVHALESLFSLITRIPTFISILVTSIGFAPNVIMPFAMATVSISVVLFIVGRNK